MCLPSAAIGVILFFIGAIITHLRARERSFGFAMIFLVMAVAALIFGSGLVSADSRVVAIAVSLILDVYAGRSVQTPRVQTGVRRN